MASNYHGNQMSSFPPSDDLSSTPPPSYQSQATAHPFGDIVAPTCPPPSYEEAVHSPRDPESRGLETNDMSKPYGSLDQRRFPSLKEAYPTLYEGVNDKQPKASYITVNAMEGRERDVYTIPPLNYTTPAINTARNNTRRSEEDEECKAYCDMCLICLYCCGVLVEVLSAFK